MTAAAAADRTSPAPPCCCCCRRRPQLRRGCRRCRSDLDSHGARPVPPPLIAGPAPRPGRRRRDGDGATRAAAAAAAGAGDGGKSSSWSTTVVPVRAELTFARQHHGGAVAAADNCWPVCWKDRTPTANDRPEPAVHDDGRSSPRIRCRNSSRTNCRCCRELSLQ